jgi:hypothetical protein
MMTAPCSVKQGRKPCWKNLTWVGSRPKKLCCVKWSLREEEGGRGRNMQGIRGVRPAVMIMSALLTRLEF